MKKFEMPEVWMVRFDAEDIMTASSSEWIVPDSENENQLPAG